MWIYLTISVGVVLFLLHKYISRYFDYWKKRNVFYLKPVSIVGNMLDLFLKDNSLGFNMLEMCQKAGYRDFFGIFVFARPTLVVNSPKLIRAILQKDFQNFIDRSVSSHSKHPILSNALFFQRNPLWKDHRTKLSPIFSSGKLKLMFPLMLKECEEMVEYISTKANINDVESKEICAKYSTNVIARCAFAVEANSFKDDDAIFRKIGRQMFDFRISTAIRQIGSFLVPDLLDRLNISIFNQSLVDNLDELFTNVLNSRKAIKNLKGNDFVDILLEARRKNGEDTFSEQAMLGQAIQFFAAGFETVSSSLSFALYELCINQVIQEKLRREIQESLKKNNGITYEELNELKYLDMCILESLRKYPPAPFLDRKCKDDYKIEDSDVIIEKGMNIFIPLLALHYNPKNFPNPEKFDPERFADKSGINKDGLSFIPFGDGPRLCIGQRFGLMEIKLGVVSILSKYRLEKSPTTPEPIKYVRKSLVLQSTVGIPLKFVPL